MKKLFIITFVFGAFLAFANQPTHLPSNLLSSEICVCEVNNGTAVAWETDFQRGWKAGHCRGWKSVKGDFAICPIPPIAPLPKIGKDSYNDGYDRGYARGYADAK